MAENVRPDLLILYARLPEPGRVKTRLAASLGDEAACAVYRAFTDSCVALGRTLPDMVLRLDYAPDTSAARKYFAARYPDVALRPQAGEGLGARMLDSLCHGLEAGHKHVCLMGSDIPDLPLRHLHAAFQLLGMNDVVFGPTGDGGYYLVGLKRPVPEIFDDARIPWSTPDVLRISQDIAMRHRLCVGLAPRWNDVDDAPALDALAARLASLPANDRFAPLRKALAASGRKRETT